MSHETCSRRSTILLTGRHGSGKSSIWNALLQSQAPHSSKNGFQTGNFGGCLASLCLVDAYEELDLMGEKPDLITVLDDTAALVFVIDGKRDLKESLSKLYSTMKGVLRLNSNIYLEVLLHKVDELSEDVCSQLVHEVRHRTINELIDCGIDGAYFEVHMTSVLDVSLFEAFSKIIRKLLSSTEMLDDIFHEFLMKSGLDFGFLLDTVNWICLTSGGHSVADLATYELCCSLANAALRLSRLYGEASDERDGQLVSTATLDVSRLVIVQQLDSRLAIAGVLQEADATKRGVIDHNISQFQTAFAALFPCYVETQLLSFDSGRRETSVQQGTS